MAYCQSYLYAQFIIEKFGSGKIGEMLAAYRDNLATTEVIQRVFQIPQAEFEARYLEYVRHLVQQIQAERPEPVTPLAEAEKTHLADPENPVTASRYAWALELARQTKTAERVARQVLDQDPRQPLAALVIARHELRARDLATAVKILERAYDREHPQPRVLEMLAELKFQQQDYSTAAEFYETGLKRRPAHVAWLKGLARCQTELKRTKPLKATLQKIVGRDPDDAVARQQLTKLVFDEQNFEEVIRYGMQALQVDVLAPEVHRMLAVSYGKRRQWSAAIREWSVLVTLKPEDGEPRRELARAQLADGDRQAAIETLQKWIEQSPDDAKARQLLEDLRQ
jgi:tetratricopeptide (TPR) repeat protein